MRTQPRPPALIRTKVRAPQLPTHNVVRPRVTALLSDAAQAPLVVVTGPPGSGKTVALQQWLVGDFPPGARLAWLSLDDADTAPARFWSYVLLALEGAGTGAFVETRALLAEAEGDDEVVVISLLNEIPQHDLTYLVLEDLHHLKDAKLVQQLELLVERAPDSLRIVASSRLDPPLPLARWRGSGRLREIGQDQLAFTADEARDLFSRFASGFDSAEVDVLTERTEGWAVALQLVALSAPDIPLRSVLDAAMHEGSPIATYLISEVLDQQPTDVREFLLDTSVLDVFDARLCDAVTGRRDSRVMLQRLRADHLFLVALQGRQYRYHQLFVELAHLQLQAEDPDGERVRTLHGRAAEWLAEQGEVVGAVRHFLAAGDVDAAFRLVVAPGMDLWDRDGDHARAELTLDLFPLEYLEREPRRIVTYAVALASLGQWNRIPPLLELAERHVDTTRDPDTRADLDVVRIATHLANGDAVRALARPPRLDVQATNDVETDLRLRARAGPNLARAYLLVDDHEAAGAALAATAPNDPITDHLVVPALRARVAACQGELEAALALVDGVLATALTMKARSHFAVLDAEMARASVHVDRVDLTAADDALEHASGLAEQRKSVGYQVMAMLLQARVAVLRDNPEDALSMLAIARRTLRAACVAGGLAEHVDAAKSRVQLILGERARALELARDVSGERGVLLRAQLALADDDPVLAADLVAADEWSNVANHLEALLVRATAESEESAARRLVAEAVERAADESFVRPFLETGTRVRDLALQAAERSPRPDAWDLGLAIRAGTVHTQSPVLLESLSGRERDVLRYLRRPLTHEEIGRELFVSTNTVRTHVRGIYRKLGVNSRAEALARARALHLL